jgi:hypothetical protein
MDSEFILKLAISFIVSGSWVVLATIFADKLGPKIGGLISGLPSSVMFGTLFIALTQDTHAAVKATTIMPILGGISCLFLLSYVALVKNGLWLSLAVSFFFWLFLSACLVILNFDNYPVSLLGYFVLLGLSYYLMEHRLKVTTVLGKKVNYTPILIVTRGALSGTIIVLSVILGKIGGPLLGGMFTMFPAMFTSTILITYFSQGVEFSAATMKSAMLSAVSVVIYSLVVRCTYIPLGIFLGTLTSIAISFSGGYLVYKLILTKLK